MSGSYRHAFETPDLRLSGLCALHRYVPEPTEAPAPCGSLARRREHNRLQTLKPFEQCRVLLPGRFSGEFLRRTRWWLAGAQGFLLGADVDLGVPVRGLKAHMAKPASNDVDLHTSLKKVDSGRVPKHVRREPARRRAWRGRQKIPVASDDLVDSEAR